MSKSTNKKSRLIGLKTVQKSLVERLSYSIPSALTIDAATARRLWRIDPSITLQHFSPAEAIGSYYLLIAVGLMPRQLHAFGKKHPINATNLKVESIKKAVTLFDSRGFTMPQFCRIVCHLRNFADIPAARLDCRISCFTSIEMSQADAVKVISDNPALLGCLADAERTGDSLKERAEFFVDVLPCLEDAHFLLKDFSNVLTQSIERSRQTVEVLYAIGADPVECGKRYLYAPALVRGRLEFLGQDYTTEELFISNREFEELHRITREDLLALDPGHAKYAAEAKIQRAKRVAAIQARRQKLSVA